MTSSPGISSQPVRVIVVDDHEWIRDIAVKLVRQTLPNACIQALENGLEALMAFRETGADFVVSNHWMPIMDGQTLIRELHEQAPDLPIVMISGHPEAKRDAEAAGANWFLTKEQLVEQLPVLLLHALRAQTGLLLEE